MATKKSNQIKGRLPPVMKRFEGNQILRPESTHWWESKTVFNPAAIYEGGKVYILYRALGDTDPSVIGYASSRGGVHIDEPSVIIAFSIGRYGNSEELFKHTSILAQFLG